MSRQAPSPDATMPSNQGREPGFSATADRGERPGQRQSPRAKSTDGIQGRSAGAILNDGVSRTARGKIPSRASGHIAAAKIHDGVLEVVWRPIDELKAYGRNSRTHTKKQIGRIEGSLERFGWTTPIGIAGDVILAGHARQQAAIAIRNRNGSIPRCPSLDVCPTVDLSALSMAERKAYVIADNKLAEEAGWDNKLLRLELSDLREMKFDLGLTGFSLPQIDVLLGKSSESGGRRISDGMRYQVVIDCAGEEEQGRLLEELRSRGLKAVPIIL